MTILSYNVYTLIIRTKWLESQEELAIRPKRTSVRGRSSNGSLAESSHWLAPNMSLHNTTGTRPKKRPSLITDSGHKNSANSQSKLGYELTAAISFKIIVVTLIMLVVLPFTFLRVTDHGYINYTRWLHQTLARDTQFTSTTQMTPIINQYLNNMRMQPVVFGIAMPIPSTYYLVQFKVFSVYI